MKNETVQTYYTKSFTSIFSNPQEYNSLRAEKGKSIDHSGDESDENEQPKRNKGMEKNPKPKTSMKKDRGRGDCGNGKGKTTSKANKVKLSSKKNKNNDNSEENTDVVMKPKYTPPKSRYRSDSDTDNGECSNEVGNIPSVIAGPSTLKCNENERNEVRNKQKTILQEKRILNTKVTVGKAIRTGRNVSKSSKNIDDEGEISKVNINKHDEKKRHIVQTGDGSRKTTSGVVHNAKRKKQTKNENDESGQCDLSSKTAASEEVHHEDEGKEPKTGDPGDVRNSGKKSNDEKENTKTLVVKGQKRKGTFSKSKLVQSTEAGAIESESEKSIDMTTQGRKNGSVVDSNRVDNMSGDFENPLRNIFFTGDDSFTVVNQNTTIEVADGADFLDSSNLTRMLDKEDKETDSLHSVRNIQEVHGDQNENETVDFDKILAELWKLKGKDYHIDQIIRMVMTKKSIEKYKNTNPMFQQLSKLKTSPGEVLDAWKKLEKDGINLVTEETVAFEVAKNIMSLSDEKQKCTASVLETLNAFGTGFSTTTIMDTVLENEPSVLTDVGQPLQIVPEVHRLDDGTLNYHYALPQNSLQDYVLMVPGSKDNISIPASHIAVADAAEDKPDERDGINIPCSKDPVSEHGNNVRVPELDTSQLDTLKKNETHDTTTTDNHISSPDIHVSSQNQNRLEGERNEYSESLNKNGNERKHTDDETQTVTALISTPDINISSQNESTLEGESNEHSESLNKKDNEGKHMDDDTQTGTALINDDTPMDNHISTPDIHVSSQKQNIIEGESNEHSASSDEKVTKGKSPVKKTEEQDKGVLDPVCNRSGSSDGDCLSNQQVVTKDENVTKAQEKHKPHVTETELNESDDDEMMIVKEEHDDETEITIKPRSFYNNDQPEGKTN